MLQNQRTSALGRHTTRHQGTTSILSSTRILRRRCTRPARLSRVAGYSARKTGRFIAESHAAAALHLDRQDLSTLCHPASRRAAILRKEVAAVVVLDTNGCFRSSSTVSPACRMIERRVRLASSRPETTRRSVTLNLWWSSVLVTLRREIGPLLTQANGRGALGPHHSLTCPARAAASRRGPRE
jgi:hypothetical protein